MAYQQSQEHPSASRSQLLRRFAAAICTLAPFGYLGVLVGVAVHEVVGHGFVSLALGGEFHGFQLDFDGMGYAYVPVADSRAGWRDVVILSGGVGTTALSGGLLLACGYALRNRPWIALPLIVTSFGLLMDGVPYVFWNALIPLPPGDIGRVIAITNGSALRVALVLAGGILMVGVIWAWTVLVFAILQSWLTGGAEVQGRARVVLLALIGFLPGIAWFTFDWNQLIPGVGALPNTVALVLHLLSAGTLLWFRPRVLPLRSLTGMKRAALVGWTLTTASVAGIAMWFRQGVFFTS